MIPLRRLVPVLLAIFLGSQASAAEPPASEFTEEEVALRLVAEAPGPDGMVRAALLVDLAPGWKTYWLDPGDAGIPPSIDASASVNLTAVSASFPVPHRFGDEAGSSNGFSQPMAVALAYRKAAAKEPSRIEIEARLGVCREVCVPVSARLSIVPEDSGAADARLVASAFEALPSPSTPETGIVSATLSSDGRTVEVATEAAPGEASRKADLFVAGPEGWFFGAPQPPRRDGRSLVFEVPVTERPKAAAAGGPLAIDAVLTLGASAYGATKMAVSQIP